MHLDDHIAVILPDRDLDPARTSVRRGRDGIQGVVDQVADNGDQVARMTGIPVEPGVRGKAELDVALSGHGGFSQQQGAEHGIADALQQRFGQLLGDG